MARHELLQWRVSSDSAAIGGIGNWPTFAYCGRSYHAEDGSRVIVAMGTHGTTVSPRLNWPVTLSRWGPTVSAWTRDSVPAPSRRWHAGEPKISGDPVVTRSDAPASNYRIASGLLDQLDPRRRVYKHGKDWRDEWKPVPCHVTYQGRFRGGGISGRLDLDICRMCFPF